MRLRRKHELRYVHGSHWQLLADGPVHLDLDAPGCAFPEWRRCPAWLTGSNIWCFQVTDPGAKADRLKQPPHPGGVGVAHQQVDVRHGTLAGRVQAVRVQGRPLQGDAGDAGFAGAGINQRQEALYARVACSHLLALVGKEAVPVIRPTPAQTLPEEPRDSVGGRDGLGDLPLKLRPLRGD